MAVKASGRFVPPSAFTAGTGKTFTGAYAWNAPREAVGRERPLTRDEMRQVQGVLSTINRLPYFLRSLFTSRYDYIRRNKSPVHGFYFLTSTFQRRLWPRIERVNQRHEMNTDASLLFLAERDHYARLPGMNDKELKKFAARISSQLFMMYEELSDAWVDAHGEKESLFMDEAQAHLYGHVAGAARAFNISPLYWKKYRKGQMTTRQAYSAIARLFNDEWWTHQLKGQRMRWHEALLIAVGEVNKDRSPYASKHAIRDVRARRQANLEFLKSCDLENRETGERIDLISKVMGSISNPEIRRMEMMNTIAGIERYAAAEGDVGMFITLNHLTLYRRPPPDFSEVVMMTLIIPRKETPVSGEGTVVIPQPAGDEPVIKNTFFFPDIDPKRVRERMRLEQTVAPARLREAIKSGMAETNAELYEYREQKIAAGFTRLADVPADDIDGESIKVFYYERAVCAMASASLYERYRGVDASAKGDKKADSIDSTIDELWRDMRWAVARIQDKPRCIVSQI